MDRDTVRLLLILVGALILVGIYLWDRFRQPVMDYLARRREANALARAEETEEAEWHPDADGGADPALHGGRREPQLSGLDYTASEPDDLYDLDTPDPGHGTTETHVDLSAEGAPFLIQISVVAGPGRFFNGTALCEALLDVDLIHGDMGIFHRYDRDLKQTLFSVASLVEPGTFPMDDMATFECPGIVLFFQTARVSDPLGIYDDLVSTSRDLASRLHGIQWDERRQPLSASKIAHMRHLLKHAKASDH
ncbi:MAG: cell division protein ZipA C-terminal FtsZ-binding domain-containing protein [Methylococcaceae bacterium]|jgi:cell division protein ZipA